MATVLTQSYPHSGGYPEIADRDDAGTSTASLSHVRPNITRRETDQILSYYQSEYAGQSHDSDDDHEQRAGLSRRSSSSSRSSSQYSAETTHRIQPVQQAEDLPPQSSAVSVAAGHIRRPSVPSQESVDRRRLAIVELDSSLPPSVRRKEGSGSGFAGGSPQSSLSSRRGIHVNGLALVAPPDASPATYTNLTPPPSAPPVSGNRGLGIAPPAAATHSRSASEAIGGHLHLHRKTSRDVGIVGVGRVIPSISETGNQSSPRLNRLTDPSLLHAPIFQTPSKSRSPSPAVQTPDLTENGTPTINSSTPPHFWDPNARDREQTSTPAIGESKDIQQPVVGPVVVGLHSGKVMRREPMHPMDINNTSVTIKGSSYPHYEAQPTAGPSLPPPRTMFDAAAAVSSPVSSAPPPRPPRMRTPMPLSQVSAPSSSPAKRDLEALKESLQLPQSVSSALASRSPSRPVLERAGTDISNESSHSDRTKESAVSDSALDAKRSRSIHRREGAFPPSNQTTAKSTPEASPVVGQESQDHSNSVPVTTVHIVHPRDPSPESVYEDTEEYDRRSAIELKRDPSWVSLKDTTIASSPNGLGQTPSASRSRSRSRSPAPQPPPKASPGPPLEEMRSPGSSHSGSSNPFKATLNNLKRFSALPRTPSSLSMKSSRTTRTDSTPRSPRTPSPALATTPRNTRPKVVNPWPDAMTFRDVSSMTSPLERASAYAQKIQQLSMCDTGLSEWLQSMQTKGTGPRPVRTTGLQLDIGLSHPSSRSSAAQQQTRHFSGASVASEATFPIRRDAYTATDLMMKPDEDLNLGKPPPIALPYPSLATKLPPPRSSTSVPPTPRSYQIPLSSGPPRSAGGFFSSIGRKASLKKSDSPPAPGRVLTKRSQSRPPQPHVISAPTIPGGPRAPPGKLQRSHTMSVGSAKPVEQPPVSVTRSDTRTSISSRRPSFFHRSAAAAAQPQPPTDEEFEKQVDKLSDLLPHADRAVLAGYLRRAGQDILAIGQYLEDEKKGAIRRD